MGTTEDTPYSFTLRRGGRRERPGLGPLRSPRGSSRLPCRPRKGCRCTSATTKTRRCRATQSGASNGGVRPLRTEHKPSSTVPCSVSGGTDRDEAAFGDATAISRRILRETAVGALNKTGAPSSADHMRRDSSVKTQTRRETFTCCKLFAYPTWSVLCKPHVGHKTVGAHARPSLPRRFTKSSRR